MPNAAYVMSGEIRVETREGQTSTFKEGQIILETVAKPHRGVTLEQPVKLLVFYAGAAGMPLSERAPTR
jgi:quercetin dioxygenase-like cupin family protein